MAKAMIYVAKPTLSLVPVNGLVPLGGIVRRFGCCIALSGNTVTLKDSGYYKVSVSATVAPVADGDVTLTLTDNGTPVVGATASALTAAAGQEVSMSIDAVVRVICPCDRGNLALEITGEESNITNVAMVVEKL